MARTDFSAAARTGWQAGALSARPAVPDEPALPTGIQAVDERARLYVPPELPAGPLPLVVLLHGATSNPLEVLPILSEPARRHRFLLLAPKSRDYTWDIVRGGFGPDVAALDQLLMEVFGRFQVDPGRVAVAGFSDGASYALSLGLASGDLFSRILAFSPGFVVPGRRTGRPAVFISHGVADKVLPIERCSRRIVPLLRQDGYDVDYREFAGGHTVPADQAAAAVMPLATAAGH